MLVVHLTIPCVCAGHAYAELCSCASHACAAHHATSTQGKGLLTFLCLSLHKHITRVLCLFFLPSQNTNAEGPEPYTIEGYHQPASSEGRRPAAAEYACILAAIPRLVALPFTAVFPSHLIITLNIQFRLLNINEPASLINCKQGTPRYAGKRVSMKRIENGAGEHTYLQRRWF